MAKLSKEVLAKLQGYGMAEGIVDYVVKVVVDTDEDGNEIFLEKKYCPKFKLRLPGNKDYKKLRKAVLAKQASGEEVDELEMTEEVINKAIIGWSNYYNTTTGELIGFDPELISSLSQKLVVQIFLFIAETTGLV